MKKRYVTPEIITEKIDDVIATSIETEFIPFGGKNARSDAYDVAAITFTSVDPYAVD